MEFRDLPAAHVDRALDHASVVFHSKARENQRKRHRDTLLSVDRVGAYERDRLVGLAAAFAFRLSVPGGELPAAGLSFVSVAPTHRRRGVLTGLVEETFRGCVRRGQPLCVLWASESAIYGRYGFGPATSGHAIEIDSSRPLALRIEPDRRPLRLIDPAEAPALLGPVHEAHRGARPGRIARDEAWWHQEILVEEDEDHEELGPPRVVVLGDDELPGGADRPGGYAVYRTRGGEDDGSTPGLVQVYELEADSPAGAAALWGYLAGIDLTKKVCAPDRPLDDPLLHLAADRDQVRVTEQFPALWLRLIDPAAAFAGRAWAAPLDVVLEVADVRLPRNAGRFRLTAGPEGASYRPSDAEPDLRLDIRDLGACYLGGTELRRLVQAGLVTEHTPGAAERFDAAFRTDLLPHTIDAF